MSADVLVLQVLLLLLCLDSRYEQPPGPHLDAVRKVAVQVRPYRCSVGVAVLAPSHTKQIMRNPIKRKA